ncbi:MAG: glycosyltransferase family 4 protein [Terriglobia bacterium]
MNKLTIAYDARFLRPKTSHWGVGVFIENVCTRLSDEFNLVGLSSGFPGARQKSIRTWPSVSKMNILMFEVSPLVGGRFDVYWGTNHYLPQALDAPSLLTVHDLLLLNHFEHMRFGGFLAWRFRSSLRRAAKIVADSRTTADDLLAEQPDLKGKIEVVPLGFGIPRLPATQGSIDGLLPAAPYALMLGCHRPRKNAGLAIAAISQLRERGLDVQLVITGDIHPSFRRAAQACPEAVTLLGVLPRSVLSKVLERALCLLFPSRYEGFGFPLLEAMAAGCPVLALDTPINHEVAAKAGCFLPEDPEKWATAIRRLMASDATREEMKQLGFENLARYSWEKTSTAYAQMFRELAN